MKLIPCRCHSEPQPHDRVWDANEREFLLQCRNCLHHKPLVAGKKYPTVGGRKKNPVASGCNAKYLSLNVRRDARGEIDYVSVADTANGLPLLFNAEEDAHAHAEKILSDPMYSHPMYSKYGVATAKIKCDDGDRARKKNPVPLSKNAQLKKASKIFEDFTGYDASQKIKIDKPEFPDVLCVIGDIDEIFYTTDRDGAIEKYRHKFAKNSRPLFCVSPDGEQIFMIGGSFKFTERGIVDTPQKKR